MADTTVKKIDSKHSLRSDHDQKYLAAGKVKRITQRDYETVGFIISGCAELSVEARLGVLAGVFRMAAEAVILARMR